MYNLKRLAAVARDGLSDLVPALQTAFNRDPGDDRMPLVYGPLPTLSVLATALVCVLVGEGFARAGPQLPMKEFVNWPAVLVALVFAALIRRYLFTSGQARKEDFGWLAASVAPAFALVMVVSPLAHILLGPVDVSPNSPGIANSDVPQLGDILVVITDSLGLAAVLTIALATLCFSRKWVDALVQLAVRLFVFRLMVWITALVMLELDIVSTLIGAIINALTGWQLPEWIAELTDQVGYAGILVTAYLAVIGGTWVVCRNGFEKLLVDGHVDILSSLEKLASGKKEKKKPDPDTKHQT